MHNRKNLKYLLLFSLVVLIYGTAFGVFLLYFDLNKGAWADKYLDRAKNEQLDAKRLVFLERAILLDPRDEVLLEAGKLALELENETLALKYYKKVNTPYGELSLANTYYEMNKFSLAKEHYRKLFSTEYEHEGYIGIASSELKLGNVKRAVTNLVKANKIKKEIDIDLLLSVLRPNGKQIADAASVVRAYNYLITEGYPQAASQILLESTNSGLVSRDGLITLASESTEGGNLKQAYDFLVRAQAIDPYYPQIYQQLIIVCKRLGMFDEAAGYEMVLSGLLLN